MCVWGGGSWLCEPQDRGKVKRQPGWVGGSSHLPCTLEAPSSDPHAQMASAPLPGDPLPLPAPLLSALHPLAQKEAFREPLLPGSPQSLGGPPPQLQRLLSLSSLSSSHFHSTAHLRPTSASFQDPARLTDTPLGGSPHPWGPLAPEQIAPHSPAFPGTPDGPPLPLSAPRSPKLHRESSEQDSAQCGF